MKSFATLLFLSTLVSFGHQFSEDFCKIAFKVQKSVMSVTLPEHLSFPKQGAHWRTPTCHGGKSLWRLTMNIMEMSTTKSTCQGTTAMETMRFAPTSSLS